ncbi:hypothetical protein AAFF_G00329620 [Aldrovandia affinis]|uniref:Uncharacterized protein n=1 Tax=Aldrovandia affinis TaxID=143900 RepID=A0AAD7WPV6_9TELE|nr:hypothetical protein AAFF_G00329620 [Aldrovandia affinis]
MDGNSRHSDRSQPLIMRLPPGATPLSLSRGMSTGVGPIARGLCQVRGVALGRNGVRGPQRGAAGSAAKQTGM